MAANTVSLATILFEMAGHVNEIQAATVTTVGGATSITCSGVAETTTNAFLGGILRKVGGSSTAQIVAFNGATKEFTFFGSGIAGLQAADVVEWCFWDGIKYGAAVRAVNDFIRQEWAVWSRETKQTRTDATITLDSITNTYALPATVHRLIRIGIQYTVNVAPEWFEPSNIWRVTGQEGAFNLEFLPTVRGAGISTVWDSRIHIYPPLSAGTFAQVFANQPLLLWYETKEGSLYTLTDTTQLPLDVFWGASDLYMQNRLVNAGEDEARNIGIALPQIQQNNLRARSTLQRSKKRPEVTVSYDF